MPSSGPLPVPGLENLPAVSASAAAVGLCCCRRSKVCRSDLLPVLIWPAVLICRGGLLQVQPVLSFCSRSSSGAAGPAFLCRSCRSAAAVRFQPVPRLDLLPVRLCFPAVDRLPVFSAAGCSRPPSVRFSVRPSPFFSAGLICCRPSLFFCCRRSAVGNKGV